MKESYQRERAIKSRVIKGGYRRENQRGLSKSERENYQVESYQREGANQRGQSKSELAARELSMRAGELRELMKILWGGFD